MAKMKKPEPGTQSNVLKRGAPANGQVAQQKKASTPPPVNPKAEALVAAMSEAAQKDQVSRWRERIALADRIYKRWEKRFFCAQGWDWYEGYQGKDAYILGDPQLDRLIVNIIYSTIEVKIPSLYFAHPKVTVIPRPSREDDPATEIQARARLREDTATSTVTDPRLRFKANTTHAMKDSFFYFGIVEVGMDRSFNVNPNQGKPILEGDRPLKDDEGEIMQPPTVPADEILFIKRIPADQFRVSARSGTTLQECDWSGYYEYVYSSDLKNDPSVINKHLIRSGAQYAGDYTGKIDLNEGDMEPDRMNADEVPTKQGMMKVWHIVDHREHTRFMIPDDGNYYLRPPTPWKVFPFAGLKHHERKHGWYPLPPHFNLMSIQAELNDTREKQRTHRKRYDRRYQMYKNSIDAGELDKLETGGDGTIIQTNVPVPAIIPIEDAPLDSAVSRNVPQSKEDFMDVSATGNDQRSNPQSGETATAATIGETRARIRESFSQANVAEWIGEIMRIALETIEKEATLTYWIRRNVDPLSITAMQEAMRVTDVWQAITSEELGELDYDVVVVAESLSPINEDVQNQKLIEFLTMLSQNMILMLMLRTSDDLLRRSLAMIGLRDEKAIQQVKAAIEIALLALTGGMTASLPAGQGETEEKAAVVSGATAAQSGGAGGGGGPASPANGAQLPGMMAAMAQIRAQMGTTGPAS